MKKLFIFSLLLLVTATSSAEMKLKMMVIPHLEENESIREKLAENQHYRDAIALLQDRLDADHFAIVDFFGKYRKYERDAFMRGDTKDDKASFLAYAAPDVFTELELTEYTCAGTKHKVRVNLKTYLTGSAFLLENKVVDSNCFVAEADVLGLMKNALNKFLEEYLLNLQNDLQQMAEKGQIVELQLLADDDAPFDFNTRFSPAGEAAPGTLFEVVTAWLQSRPEAVLNFEVTGNSPRYMLLEELRMPLLTPDGRLVPVEDLTRPLRQFLENMEGNEGEKILVEQSRLRGTVYLRLKSG